MKKVITATISLLIVLIIIIANRNSVKVKNDPEVNLQFRVFDLSDKEFESVGTNNLENPTKSDFKNIEFTLDEKQSNKISNRKIIVSDLKKVANSYDRERYWFGKSYSQDNQQSEFAKYSTKFVLYSKGLDEQGIKNIFKSAEVKVSWTTEDGNNEERLFRLGDIIQFK